ncbi:MAG TPA: hypothetical protein VK943_20220 [Arenibaculum sp.]|nr:hypothetical protein [Arenibaculum sp.]
MRAGPDTGLDIDANRVVPPLWRPGGRDEIGIAAGGRVVPSSRRWRVP